MIIIAHRGNSTGTNPVRENSEEYIHEALSNGYEVEIDVWYQNNTWYLGHDGPTYKTTVSFLKQPKLWCHAKNIPALTKMLESDIHCFFHNVDAVVLTSKGYIWTYPGNELTAQSICVMPEWKENNGIDYSKAAGICTDNIVKYAHTS